MQVRVDLIHKLGQSVANIFLWIFSNAFIMLQAEFNNRQGALEFWQCEGISLLPGTGPG